MEMKTAILEQIQEWSVAKTKVETKSHYRQKYNDSYYDNLIWNSPEYEDVERIQVELIPVENDNQRDLFDYIRHTVSSMPQCQVPGRVLSVLVHDANSKRYLGIVQLTTDLLKSEFKDQFIELEERKRGQLKKHIRDHSVNMSICVPVQPFGFNFCGGKLLAMLAFSMELHRFYEQRYANVVALVTTTSIHGKSVQYDRLKQLKFVGYTKGFGTSHIPASFMEKVDTYVEENYPQFNVKKQSKWQILKFLMRKLNIDASQLFYHGDQRGIYCGWTGTEAKSFLLKRRGQFDQNQLQSVDDIALFWKQRWARQRAAHLNREKA